MMIDPKRKRRRTHRYSDRGTAPAPTIVLVGLAVEVACLTDLSEWEPVGALLEAIPATLNGTGSITLREVRRLRAWAHNWRALTDSVRGFYSANCQDDDVQSGLWYILGSGRKPTGYPLGLLRRAYINAHGFPASSTLLPSPATQDTP